MHDSILLDSLRQTLLSTPLESLGFLPTTTLRVNQYPKDGQQRCNLISIVAPVLIIENKGLITTKMAAGDGGYHFL
jgi:hypothetical protein